MGEYSVRNGNLWANDGRILVPDICEGDILGGNGNGVSTTLNPTPDPTLDTFAPCYAYFFFLFLFLCLFCWLVVR